MKRVKRRASNRQNVQHRRDRGLTRPEMISILCYCKHWFWNDFVKRAYMLKSTVDDVAGDVGVYVWTAIIRYRKKPYTEVLKLGFRTAQNRLISISRTNLNKPDAPIDIETFLPFLKATSIDPAKRVEFLNMMYRVTYELVGTQKAEYLLNATKLDWSLRNRKFMTKEHEVLCKKLDMIPHQVYKHVLAIRDVMWESYALKAEVSSIKENGIWTQQNHR